jgi:hypothetical protein
MRQIHASNLLWLLGRLTTPKSKASDKLKLKFLEHLNELDFKINNSSVLCRINKTKAGRHYWICRWHNKRGAIRFITGDLLEKNYIYLHNTAVGDKSLENNNAI